MKRSNMKSVDWINFTMSWCQRPTMKERIHCKTNTWTLSDKLKNSRKTAMNFTENGLRNKQFWFTKTTSFNNLKTQFKTCKTRKPSWNKRSPDSMITTAPLKNKSRKLKSISKDSNKKWTNWMTQLPSTATKSLNFKTKTLTLSPSSLKNSRKWKDKPSNFKLTSIKSDKKRLNSWIKLSSVKDKFCCGKESINLKVKCNKLLTPMLVNPKSNNSKKNFTEWNLSTTLWSKNKTKSQLKC